MSQTSLNSFFTRTPKSTNNNNVVQTEKNSTPKYPQSNKKKIEKIDEEECSEVEVAISTKPKKRQRLQMIDSDEEEPEIDSGNRQEAKNPKKNTKKRKPEDEIIEDLAAKHTPKSCRNTKDGSFVSSTPTLLSQDKQCIDSLSFLSKFSVVEDASDERNTNNGIIASPKSSKTKKNESLLCLTPRSTSAIKIGEHTRSFLSSFCADDSVDPYKIELESTSTNFKHLNFEFLFPDKIRDANKLLPTDPNYDPHTLFIPDAFLKKETPGLKQWWEIKRHHFDTILLFKVGKFYELYHMDAVIGVKELNLSFMKGDFAHAGFPEIAYSRFADQLVERGFKVARVEQTETPEMLEERNAKTPRSGTKEKVVKRELCRITTSSTKTYGVLDGDSDSAQGRYLFAICEEVVSNVKSSIGLCFVDTSVGLILMSQFEDSDQFSKLQTVFAEFSPTQILYPRSKLSSRLESLLKSSYGVIPKESLASKSQFWTAEQALKKLSSASYFEDEKKGVIPLQSVPVLNEFLSPKDPLGLTPKSDCQLALSSLGAIIWYLSECLIDIDVLSLQNFQRYIPFDDERENTLERSKQSQAVEIRNKTMILDGVTLKNLEIFQNNDNCSVEGTLLEKLDTCSTPFGKRLLRHWLCNPSCVVSSIKLRQSAVTELLTVGDFVSDASKLLKNIPDLERLLQKINTLGSKRRKDNHPDSRAVLYNMDVYNKRKVNDLLSALDGFTKAKQVAELFSEKCSAVESKLLRKCLLTSGEGRFPLMNDALRFFDKCFDHDKAKKDGIIIPTSKGIDESYDTALRDINEAEEHLNSYLKKLRTRYSCSAIDYINSGRNRYQLEVPETIASKLSDEFEFESQRKGYKRYTTETLNGLKADLQKSETARDVALKDVMRRVFAAFTEHINIWRQAIECVSVVDVLMAFTRFAQNASYEVCCPDIMEPTSRPFLQIESGVHPCLVKNNSFIPNDTIIGETEEGNGSNILLITGPNMGGKSTIMRQVSLIVIIAQIGCYVPAKHCTLSPVDRIFTRIGASDRLTAGQSTFFVELSETCAILKHATRHSLVILDELGRGTATHDGTAIAYAVLKELATNFRCRTLFSTHYHTLVDEFANTNISMMHMACAVDNENNDDPTEETITFLYKLENGSCPKSHGFHAAKLAGIPVNVIRRAWDTSRKLQIGCSSQIRSLTGENVVTLSDTILIDKLVQALKV